MQAASAAPGPLRRAAERLAAVAAVAGGMLVLSVAAIVTVSVIGRWLFNKPIPADYEFVEIGIGVAVFAFLPYTQLRNGHIAVDTFTQKLPARWNAVVDAVWDLLLAAFLGLFTWGLFSGAQESFAYNETLVQLPWPIWPVYAVCALLCGVAFVSAVAVALLKFGDARMSGLAIAGIGFAAMLVLIAARMPIALAMLVTGAAGYAYLSGLMPLFYYLQTNTYRQFASYTLSVIPLFILMGALAERSGMAATLFQTAERRLGKVRGGLPMAVILACTGFGAICGSSVATTATFGRAAMPELRRARVDPGFATGTIAAGGTLGILIPPSVILVIYAITAEQNIAKLFQAALIPGLLASAFYLIAIAIMVRRKPAIAPPVDREIERLPQPGWARPAGAVLLAAAVVVGYMGTLSMAAAVLAAVIGLLFLLADFALVPAGAVAIIVVGGIYGGVFTPTEGAAVGVIAMLAFGLAQRSLGLVKLRDALLQTAETSGMIFLILFGAEVFGAFLALTRMPETVAGLIGESGLTPYVVLVSMLLTYIVLGAVMDELAMILLTLPVFVPIVLALDFGMSSEDVAIWFGILVLVVVGIGLAAPPIGLNVFIINKIARDVPIAQTYRGVIPFVVADLIRLAILTALPVLSLWLVHLLN